jgi:hypothetical protein
MQTTTSYSPSPEWIPLVLATQALNALAPRTYTALPLFAAAALHAGGGCDLPDERLMLSADDQ